MCGTCDPQTKSDKCPCGMPLSEGTRCQCEPGKCIHCCSCDKNCSCLCQAKAPHGE